MSAQYVRAVTTNPSTTVNHTCGLEKPRESLPLSRPQPLTPQIRLCQNSPLLQERSWSAYHNNPSSKTHHLQNPSIPPKVLFIHDIAPQFWSQTQKAWHFEPTIIITPTTIQEDSSGSWSAYPHTMCDPKERKSERCSHTAARHQTPVPRSTQCLRFCCRVLKWVWGQTLPVHDGKVEKVSGVRSFQVECRPSEKNPKSFSHFAFSPITHTHTLSCLQDFSLSKMETLLSEDEDCEWTLRPRESNPRPPGRQNSLWFWIWVDCFFNIYICYFLRWIVLFYLQ